MEGLTDEQRQAATTIDAPVIIVAGPGTGKTQTLTHRIAFLVSEQHVDPRQILAVTFTNRAANEMRTRLRQLLGSTAEKLSVSTFHSFCLQALRQHAEAAGLPENFALIDQKEEAALLRAETRMSAGDALASIETISEKRRNLEDASSMPGFRTLEQAIKTRHVLGLDAIIPRCVRMLQENPGIREQVSVEWVCIDEYQDLNKAQYELVRLLSPGGRGLCVIGDPDQAIYGFRGSDVRYFLQFTRDFSDARVFGLTHNFRSSKTIVAASDQVMTPGKTDMSVASESILGSGRQIRFHQAGSAAAEAEFITHEIEKWLGGAAMFSVDSERVTGYDQTDSVSLGDIAVLVRLRALIKPLAHALTRLGLPVQVIGDQPFIDHEGARQVVETLRNLPAHTLVLPAGDAVAAFETNKSALAKLDKKGKEALEECGKLAGLFTGTLRDFLDHLLLRQGSDRYDRQAERITIMTLHAAKGLEFPIVFVAACEDGILPYAKPGETPEAAVPPSKLNMTFRDSSRSFGATCMDLPTENSNIDEERRLLYVGMTRARQVLYITSARQRLLFGKSLSQRTSPFVREIENNLRENLETTPRKRRTTDNQMEFDFAW